MPACATVTAGSAVVIAAGIVVALRCRGCEAQGFGGLADRADLVGHVILVDLDTLEAADQGFLELAWPDGLFGHFAQRDDRILVAVTIDGEFRASLNLARALRREQHELETVRDFVDTIFDGNARHAAAPL